MKPVSINDLKVGDVFAKEMRLHNRESFLVEKINDKSVTVTKRSDKKKYKTESKIKKFGMVYLLGTKQELDDKAKQLLL